jgi:hypothetical protein
LKRIVSVGLALVAVTVGTAAARPSYPPHFATAITVDHVAVSPNGTLVVSGRVRSATHRCDRFREVDLVQVRPGRDRVLDIALSSIGGREWAMRSQPGAADGSPIAVRAPREWQGFDSVTIDPHGHVINERRVVKRICKAARAPVDYVP